MEQGPDLYENQEIPVTAGNIDYILLTHAHIDHIIAVDEIKNSTGARLIMHKNEEEIYKNGDWNMAYHFKKEPPQSEADILADDNDEIKMDSVKLKFIHTVKLLTFVVS